jgi:fucose permease
LCNKQIVVSLWRDLKYKTTNTIMTASTSLAIVNTTIGSLSDNFTAILPVLLPVVIVVTVLFFAWRKIHGLAKGK